MPRNPLLTFSVQTQNLLFRGNSVPDPPTPGYSRYEWKFTHHGDLEKNCLPKKERMLSGVSLTDRQGGPTVDSSTFEQLRRIGSTADFSRPLLDWAREILVLSLSEPDWGWFRICENCFTFTDTRQGEGRRRRCGENPLHSSSFIACRVGEHKLRRSFNSGSGIKLSGGVLGSNPITPWREANQQRILISSNASSGGENRFPFGIEIFSR